MHEEIRNRFHILVGESHGKKSIDGMKDNNKTDHRY
jgi:hypothetical protein